MQEIVIYSKSYCPYCRRALALLDIKGAEYRVIDVTDDKEREREMQQRSGRTSVPQIFIGGKAIGGCDELFALDEQGKLDPLLTQLSA